MTLEICSRVVIRKNLENIYRVEVILVK